MRTADCACRGHRDHETSSCSDLRFERRSEVDALTGAVVALAAKAGLEAPPDRLPGWMG